MRILRAVRFPPPIDGVLRALSDVGFFERSCLIGSWVMLPYKELYGVRDPLRTLDVDFAIQIDHPQKQMRADLEQLIGDLGFVGFKATGGVKKFSAKSITAHGRPGPLERFGRVCSTKSCPSLMPLFIEGRTLTPADA